MRKISKPSLILLLVLFFYGCSVIKSTPTKSIDKIPVAYDYAPPDEGFKKSKEISFILIEPEFAKDFEYTSYAPFSTFSKSMGNDYVEMLTKRGYKYIGPIHSYGEIVYSDKKNTDLLLETELAFDLTGGTPFRYTTGSTLLTNQPYTRYYADGELVLTGKINFHISEPFTHTKIWVKSIPIAAQRISIQSSRKDYNNINQVQEDPAVWNAFVTTLKEVYTKSLQTAWTYLDPEELLEKKKEASEIRKNSSFQKN